jgi:hypothetical protein
MGLAEREILMLEYGYYNFLNPPCMASGYMLVSRIAAYGTSCSPRPCHAWQKYTVTIAHRVEVKADPDGLASALHSCRCLIDKCMASNSRSNLNAVIYSLGWALCNIGRINASSKCSLGIHAEPWALATNHATGTLVFPWALLGVCVAVSL